MSTEEKSYFNFNNLENVSFLNHNQRLNRLVI